VEKRIKELRRVINRHNRLYYAEGKPEISDSEYDKLVRELRKLENENPGYITEDSPTQKIGAPARAGFEKIRHTASMLSLESVNTEEECLKFDATCKKELGIDSIDYVCEPKLDGLSVELVYEDGLFVRGSTRGDGYVGEDVTENLRTVKNIPKKLKGADIPRRFAVRGEVLIHISDFQELNKKQAESGKNIFANPRNVASGSLRQLDPGITAERKLDIYCYRILDSTGDMPSTQKEMIELLKKAGFKPAPNTKHCESIYDAIKTHHDLEKNRDELDYEIDGVVVKVNDLICQEKLGVRTTNPKWAVAYKFEPRKEITKIENIVVQVGRTGQLTPVALLHPVEVGGVTVSRATLHNMDEIQRLGVKIGDYVKVQRAGDVIPKVNEVMTARRSGKEKGFKMPNKCPSCGSTVEKEDVHYRCSGGFFCPAQLKGAIAHYTSKGAVDIEGLSDKTVEQLYEENLISSVSDIYGLKGGDLLKLEGWKSKKTQNLLNAIETSKDVTLDRFIYGLGIRNVGKHIASLLARKFGDLQKIMSATQEELLGINEIGPEIAESVVRFFRNKRNSEEISKLLEKGVRIRQKVSKGKLADMKIVFTGSLNSFTRSEAKKMVESEGGETLSSVSDTTDLVVAGEKAGSKLDAANKKGIKVITEEEFKQLIA